MAEPIPVHELSVPEAIDYMIKRVTQPDFISNNEQAIDYLFAKLFLANQGNTDAFAGLTARAREAKESVKRSKAALTPDEFNTAAEAELAKLIMAMEVVKNSGSAGVLYAHLDPLEDDIEMLLEGELNR